MEIFHGQLLMFCENHARKNVHLKIYAIEIVTLWADFT